MATAFKLCPQCGEQTALNAGQCEACGHWYRTKFTPALERTQAVYLPGSPPPTTALGVGMPRRSAASVRAMRVGILGCSALALAVVLRFLLIERPVRTLSGHTAIVRSVAFAAGGRLLATGSEDKTVKLWELPSGRETRVIGAHTGAITAVAFSADGRTIATGSADKTVKLWDAATGQQNVNIEFAHEVHRIAFSPTEPYLAIVCMDEDVRLFNVRTGKNRALKGHRDTVWCASFSPDGKTLATGSYDNDVKLWDTTSGKEKRTLKHRSRVFCAAFAPDGSKLVTTGAPSIVVWDTSTWQGMYTINGQGKFAESLCFSPDSRIFATANSNDHTVNLWDAETGRQLHAFEGNATYVTALGFSSDGQFLAAGGEDGTLKLWRVPRDF